MARQGVPGPAGSCELDILGPDGAMVFSVTFDAMVRSHILRILVEPVTKARTPAGGWLSDALVTNLAAAEREPQPPPVFVDLDEQPIGVLAARLGTIARLIEDLRELDDEPRTVRRVLLESVAGTELVEQVLLLEAQRGCSATDGIAGLSTVLVQAAARYNTERVAKYRGHRRGELLALVRRTINLLDRSACPHPALERLRTGLVSSRRLLQVPQDPLAGEGTEQRDRSAPTYLAEGMALADDAVSWSADGRRAEVRFHDPRTGVSTEAVVTMADWPDRSWRVEAMTRPQARIWVLLYDDARRVVGAALTRGDDDGRVSATVEALASRLVDVYVGPNPRRTPGDPTLDVLRRAITAARSALHANAPTKARRRAGLWWDAAVQFSSVEAFARSAAAFEELAAITDDDDERDRSLLEARIWRGLAADGTCAPGRYVALDWEMLDAP
jgi:hypothetical protein